MAQGLVYLLAKAGLTVNGQSAGILTVLVFGAGTDYALLLIARYREELHNYRDKHDAMMVALRRALPAVLASGATVIISLLCLLVSELNSDRGLGPVGAAGIFCALLAMTTLASHLARRDRPLGVLAVRTAHGYAESRRGRHLGADRGLRRPSPPPDLGCRPR